MGAKPCAAYWLVLGQWERTTQTRNLTDHPSVVLVVLAFTVTLRWQQACEEEKIHYHHSQQLVAVARLLCAKEIHKGILSDPHKTAGWWVITLCRLTLRGLCNNNKGEGVIAVKSSVISRGERETRWHKNWKKLAPLASKMRKKGKGQSIYADGKTNMYKRKCSYVSCMRVVFTLWRLM